MTELTVITVHHRCVDGWHVFTSADVHGLYVASKDPLKAVEDVIPSVRLLIEMNEGIKCEIRPTTSFREFVEAVRAAQAEQDAAGTIPHPAVIESQRLVVWQEAA